LTDFLDAVTSSASVLGQGLLVTVKLTVLSVLFSAIAGLVLAAMNMAGGRVGRLISNAYLGLIRGTPLVTQLFIIYFGLVSIVSVSAFWAAVIGLSVHSAAYMAEIFRSGVQSIPTGQWESARSVGMSRTLTLRVVISPQAFRAILPALGNQVIIALKDTAVASFITVPELFAQAQRLAAYTFEPLTYYVISGAYYLVLVLALTALLKRLEKRHARYAI
jgi:polar amino acid transport system permease protein